MELLKKLGKGLLVSCLLLPQIVSASPITSNVGLGTTTVVDFSQFVGDNQYSGVTGPVQIGDLVGMDISVVSATSDLYLFDEGWGLSDNGNWTTGGRTGFVGVWPGSGPVRIDFNDGPVSTVGFFMNYCPPSNPTAIISVFNSDAQLLETFDVSTDAPISTPGGVDAGEFRGIVRPTAEIAYVELFGQCGVYDDMEFIAEPLNLQPVPVNATWALLLLSLGLLLIARYGIRRQNRF